MRRLPLALVTGAAAAALLLGGTLSMAQTDKAAPKAAPAGKPGGSLNVMLREDLPQGFAIHETATISTVFPAAPCFSNLVFFDSAKPVESLDTIVGELAEKWSWQDNYRNLVFFLRKGVKWHDGQPFTAKESIGGTKALVDRTPLIGSPQRQCPFSTCPLNDRPNQQDTNRSLG
jgi:ABC-type transport system substrate-binding protein